MAISVRHRTRSGRTVALACAAAALAPPELPDRRFPVLPRLQRRRR